MPTFPLHLLSILASALAAVTVEVYDRDGRLAASASVPLPAGTPSVRGDYVMHNLPKGALTWKYTKMQMRGEEVPVVTELAGIRSTLPATVWALTHAPAGGGGDRDDAGLLDITVADGDTLQRRLWAMGDLVKARKARATPAPTLKPAPPQAAADEDEEDDAAALARERRGQREKDVGGEYVVSIEEQEGGSAGGIEGGSAEL